MLCEDMISVLPEDLLVMILSRVPTKDAVATMILSKRWLCIWTMILKLDYKDSDVEDDSDDDEDDSDDDTDDTDDDDDDDDTDDDDDDDDEHEDIDGDDDEHDEQADIDDDDDDNEEKDEKEESKKSVWWFLDKSLQLHKAPSIYILCVELGRRCPTDVDVGKWVGNAVDRYVRVLTFKLLWSADPVSLPKTFYSCKSLLTLTLSHKILVDVPSSASLSSLTFLELIYVVYKDEDSLVRFLSSCPILESLIIKRNKKDDNVTNLSVKVPSLTYLEYENERRLPKNIDGGDHTGRCLVIDTPALTHFRIFDSTGDSCSFSTEVPRLDTALFDVDFCPDDKLLRILSSLSNFLLILNDAVVSSFSSIKFARLRVCTVLSDMANWMEPTILLLQNSPKLQTLTVSNNCTGDEPEDVPHPWNLPSSVPGCLSSQLEIFEWTNYGGIEEEEQFLAYVLANAKCLKTAIISLRPAEKEVLMAVLNDIPRVSTESQLIFYTYP